MGLICAAEIRQLGQNAVYSQTLACGNEGGVQPCQAACALLPPLADHLPHLRRWTETESRVVEV